MLEWHPDGDKVKKMITLCYKESAQRKAISEIQTDESIDVGCNKTDQGEGLSNSYLASP